MIKSINTMKKSIPVAFQYKLNRRTDRKKAGWVIKSDALTKAQVDSIIEKAGFRINGHFERFVTVRMSQKHKKIKFEM